MARHLVLDIDECLAKTFGDVHLDILVRIMTEPELFHLRSRVYVVKCDDGLTYWGVKRPHLDRFLAFAFSKFETVSVWTAGTYEYAHEMVAKLFANTRMPDLVMSRDEIESKGEQYCKPLDRYFVKIGRGADRSNTLILDNRFENFVRNPENGVHIPDYDPEPTIEGITSTDNNLLLFTMFVNSITSIDIRRVDKSRIFHGAVTHVPRPSLPLRMRFRDVTCSVR